MLFLKRMVARWVSEAYQADEVQVDSDAKYPANAPMARKKSIGHLLEDDTSFKNPMNITLYNAVGGRIIKFHAYDRHTDNTNETTYIVSNDEDFESALSKFITLEAMKYTPND